jgi:two-component system cell cycle response regulator
VSARILVVDDVLANVRLLEVRLRAEYFDVRTARGGEEALKIARSERIDVVLLDIMMPGLSGFDVCTALKSDPKTAPIPVVIVTALDGPADRVRALECGADDFLTKPVSDVALLARVKSLARLKATTDELQVRASAMETVGIDPSTILTREMPVEGRILVVDDLASTVDKAKAALGPKSVMETATTADEALALAGKRDFDLIITSRQLPGADGLRLCSDLKSIDRSRFTPILMVTEPDDLEALRRALEMGVNDYVLRPIDEAELRARAHTQIKRKSYADCLRNLVNDAVELAVKDPLTGLYNRRYLDSHLRSLLARSANSSEPVSLLMFDIDLFKSVNDAHGHASGDAVLVEFAERLKDGVRGTNLVARFGGEEFIIVMPGTDLDEATSIADRLRCDVACRILRSRSALALSHSTAPATAPTSWSCAPTRRFTRQNATAGTASFPRRPDGISQNLS